MIGVVGDRRPEFLRGVAGSLERVDAGIDDVLGVVADFVLKVAADDPAKRLLLTRSELYLLIEVLQVIADVVRREDALRFSIGI